MAPLKSDLCPGSSQNLNEIVDPTLGVRSTLKESARITLKLRTVVGSLLLALSPRWALNILAYRYGGLWNSKIRISAAGLIMSTLAPVGVSRAVLEAYDAEHAGNNREGHRFVECLKPRFNRKVLEAALRLLGTLLGLVILCLGLAALTAVHYECAKILFDFPQCGLAVQGLIVLPPVAGWYLFLWYTMASLFLGLFVCVLEPGTWGMRAFVRSYKLLNVNGHGRTMVALLLLDLALNRGLLSVIIRLPKALVEPSIGTAAAMLMTNLEITLLNVASSFSEVVFTVFYLKCRAYGSAVKNNVEMDSRGHQHQE